MRVLFVTNMWPTNRKPNYGIFVKKIFNHFQIYCEKCSVIMPQTNLFNLISISYLLFYLKSFFYAIFISADLIYIHYSSHSSLGVILAKPFTKKKIVLHVHGTDLLGKAATFRVIYSLINKRIIAISDLIIAPSTFFEEILLKQYKCPSSKILVSPSGGVDRRIFYPTPKKNHNEKITLGFASNLIEGKGAYMLLKAIHSLINKGFDKLSLKIVGIGPEKEKLDNYIINNNLKAFVEFMPTLSHPELGNFFRTLDFFIFPTLLPESLGLVGLEAMACGVPVIGSNIGGIPGYLVHNHNGFLFEPGNYLELEKHLMSSLLMNKNQYESMQLAAIKTASTYDSIRNNDNLVKEFHRIIRGNN